MEFEEFEREISALRCVGTITIPTNNATTICRVTVPAAYVHEMRARISAWIYEDTTLPPADDAGKIYVYRNDACVRCFTASPEDGDQIGFRVQFRVYEGDEISLVVTNGRKSQMMISEIEIVVRGTCNTSEVECEEYEEEETE